MAFLTEAQISQLPEAIRLAQARVSKLGNLKLHLKALLAKKVRLELEIKHIQTVIKKRGKTSSKELRLSLNLEHAESLDQHPERLQGYQELSPELLELLREGDHEAKEIILLLKEEKLISPEEDQELHDNL